MKMVWCSPGRVWITLLQYLFISQYSSLLFDFVDGISALKADVGMATLFRTPVSIFRGSPSETNVVLGDFCPTPTSDSSDSLIFNTPTRHHPVKFCTCKGSVNKSDKSEVKEPEQTGAGYSKHVREDVKCIRALRFRKIVIYFNGRSYLVSGKSPLDLQSS